MVAFAALARAGDEPAVPQFDPAKAARGKAALEQRPHLPSIWPAAAFDRLPKVWGTETPADLAAAARDRYGLHPAPFANGRFPMGLRELGGKDLVVDCMLCHGGSILGKSYVGLPNTTLDWTLLATELSRASGYPPTSPPFSPGRTRGVTNAGAAGIFLVAFRNPDFSRRLIPLSLGWGRMPDIDAPAWWLLKRKRWMYCDGGMAADSTRSMMQFLLGLTRDKAYMDAAEPVWDDIRHYLLSLEAPKYPLPVDAGRAAAGAKLFEENCRRCHGTYGPGGTYPNRIVAIDEIGTDRARYDGIGLAAIAHYNRTWYGEKHPARHTDGYVAPPLDGLWATAPYFHNGSAPTAWDVLDSSRRPRRYWRHRGTGADEFDAERLGWKVKRIDGPLPDRTALPAVERLRLYDSAAFGNGVEGHTYGDHLDDRQRRDLIEYLKTL